MQFECQKESKKIENFQQNVSSDEDEDMNNIEASFDYNDKYEDDISDEEDDEDDEEDTNYQDEFDTIHKGEKETKNKNQVNMTLRMKSGEFEKQRFCISKQNEIDQIKEVQPTIGYQTLSGFRGKLCIDEEIEETKLFDATYGSKIVSSQKHKSMITFQVFKNDQILPQKKKNAASNPIKPVRETFRVLPSPRDKQLPNIDKLKAKFTKIKAKPPLISSKCWTVFSGKNKRLLAGCQEDFPREIASLTKMMTCFIVCHYIHKLNLIPEKTFFRVSEHAASQQGTSAELKEGDVVNITDLLYGMMLPSGNDAAFVLAENFGVYIFMQSDEFKEKYGNQKNKYKVKNPITYFIREMNNWSEKLNMVDTYFTNPHGLMQKKNKSSAYDVGLLAYQLIHDPLASEIVLKQVHTASILTESLQPKEPPKTWKNSNKLLKKAGYLGLKTGITCAAGPCLASWYKQGPINIIVILLGAKSLEDRWIETQQLVDWTKNYLDEKGNVAQTQG